MQLITINIVRFILLVFIQIFIVNNIDFGSLNYLVSPIVYISFIFTLPVNLNRFLLLLLAFVLGLTIDFFLDSYGVHASACVLIAYLKPRFTNQMETQNTFQTTYNLSVHMVDTIQYLVYLSSLTAIFFFWLFLLEEFSFVRLHYILIKTILSTIISVLFMIVGQFLFFNKPQT